VYADASLPLDHRLAARGVRLVCPQGSVFGGLTAVYLAGGHEFATADDPVELILPPGTRWRPGSGVVVRTAAASGDVVRDEQGLRRTGPVRTAVDLIRRGPVDDGVVLLDRLVHAGLANLTAVRDAADALPRCRGSAQARTVARWADGLAESPPETRLRLLLIRAELPPPVAQFRIFDQLGFVARVDLAYPELRLAIEYDGVWHAEPGQFARDRRRLNRLSAAQWRVLFVTALDMRDPDGLVRRVIEARGR
jgi:hypothetical protein